MEREKKLNLLDWIRKNWESEKITQIRKNFLYFLFM